MNLQLRHPRGALDLSQPVVMGILNVTPDSFSDGGRYVDPERAFEHAQRMIEEGAAIIDIGGESTRPGANAVDAAEELRRVLPLVQRLASRSAALISVDTSEPVVMRAVIDAGAGMINDVRALQRPGALRAAADTQAAVCLMHMQRDPATMQQQPQYRQVVTEVRAWLATRVRAAGEAGVASDRLCVDPGFGFGKSLEHNLRLLGSLQQIAADGPPVLVGLSRKSMLQALTGREVGERGAGSVALAALAVMYGARIVRAHDVAATVDAVRVAGALAAVPAQEREGDT